MNINLNNPEVVRELEALLSHAFSLTQTPPTLALLNIEPGRVAGFLNGFLTRHRLEIHRTGPTPPRVTNRTALKP